MIQKRPSVKAKKPSKSRKRSREKKLRAGEKRTVKFALEGTVTAAEFTEILGLTDQTLRNYAAEGMPKASRGRYPLRDAMRWIMDRNAKREAAPAAGPTRADLERDLMALKLKKAQGEVFDRKEVMDALLGSYTRLGNAHEDLATRIGRELNLPGEDVKMIRDMTDEMRVRFVQDCGEFIEVTEPGIAADERAGKAA